MFYRDGGRNDLCHHALVLEVDLIPENNKRKVVRIPERRTGLNKYPTPCALNPFSLKSNLEKWKKAGKHTVAQLVPRTHLASCQGYRTFLPC